MKNLALLLLTFIALGISGCRCGPLRSALCDNYNARCGCGGGSTFGAFSAPDACCNPCDASPCDSCGAGCGTGIGTPIYQGVTPGMTFGDTVTPTPTIIPGPVVQ